MLHNCAKTQSNRQASKNDFFRLKKVGIELPVQLNRSERTFKLTVPSISKAVLWSALGILRFITVLSVRVLVPSLTAKCPMRASQQFSIEH